jgi:hypothetical protein
MSGRSLGYCAENNDSGYVSGDFLGCGMGRGRALRGRGFGAAGRGGWPPVPSAGITPAPAVNEVDRLKAQIDGLEKSLHLIKQSLLKVEGGTE